MRRLFLAIIILLFSLITYAQNYNMFKDKRDGNHYNTIKIGNQVWMKQNLSYHTDEGSWSYDEDWHNQRKYGYLYDWRHANNVCPEGWHLPSKQEFQVLIDNCKKLGQNAYEVLTAEGKDGFSASFGGYLKKLTYEGMEIFQFRGKGYSAYYWSSAKEKSFLHSCDYDGSYLNISKDSAHVDINTMPYTFGASVRCIKD